MHLKTRNVNTAFRLAVEKIHEQEWPVIRQPSHNGNVLRTDEPVTVTYTYPKERVLFNAARDCNPFFHLYEALWMLAGRNDVAPLAYYNPRMTEFSDDGKTLNGAYGYRWRKAWGWEDGCWQNTTDQLDLLVSHLKADPNSRRAVLQMWNVEDDLLKIGQSEDVYGKTYFPGSKDVCCNLSVMFSLRAEPDGNATGTGPGSFLDMTVTNRSNDLVWGMLGADYVHFTFLQEYMAARLGAEVGLYHHFTNNLHVYDWNWKPEEWLGSEAWSPSYEIGSGPDLAPSAKGKSLWNSVPLVRDPKVFERELPVITRAFDGTTDEVYTASSEPFLDDVVRPTLTAFRLYKRGLPLKALDVAGTIAADDWRIACRGWLERRVKK